MGDYFTHLVGKPEPELNEIIKGYLVIALQDTGKERDEIIEALDALDAAFDNTDAEQARRAYREI